LRHIPEERTPHLHHDEILHESSFIEEQHRELCPETAQLLNAEILLNSDVYPKVQVCVAHDLPS